MKDAVKTIKQYRSCKLDIDRLKALKKLYPDMVPNVFYRLWKTDYEPEEKRQRMMIMAEAKQTWRRRLKDQGRLDSEVEIEEVTQQYVSAGSQSYTNYTSQPYLNPMHINLRDNSPLKASL